MAPNRRVKCEAESNDFSDPALIIGFRTISLQFFLSRVLARRSFGGSSLSTLLHSYLWRESRPGHIQCPLMNRVVRVEGCKSRAGPSCPTDTRTESICFLCVSASAGEQPAGMNRADKTAPACFPAGNPSVMSLSRRLAFQVD